MNKTYELQVLSNKFRLGMFFGLLCSVVLFFWGFIDGSLYGIFSPLIGIAIFAYILFAKVILQITDDEIKMDMNFLIFKWKKNIRIKEIKRITIFGDTVTIETEKPFSLNKGTFSEKDLEDFLNTLNTLKEKYNV